MTTWSINSSINNGYPYHSDISIPYPVEFTEPYPKWMWMQNDLINNGYPYFSGWGLQINWIEPLLDFSLIKSENLGTINLKIYV